MSPDANTAHDLMREELEKTPENAEQAAAGEAEILVAQQAAEEARARASAVVEGVPEGKNPIAEASDEEIDEVFAGLS